MPSLATCRRSLLVLLLSTVACEAQGPEAAPTASSDAPIVRGSAPSLPTLTPVPPSLLRTGDPSRCSWAVDDAAIRGTDPEGRSPLNDALRVGNRTILLSDTQLFEGSDDAWSASRHRLPRASGAASAGGVLYVVGDEEIRRRDGAGRWHEDPRSSATRPAQLVAISGSAKDQVFAVGWRDTDAGSRPAILRITGRLWTGMSVPGLGAGGTQRLNDVARDGARSAVAVGVAEVRSVGQPLVLRFDGRRWSRERVPAIPGSSWTELNSVASTPAGWIAVGEAWMRDGLAAVAYRFVDDSWQRLDMPRPGLHDARDFAPPYGPSLLSIASSGTDVFAVGESITEHPRAGELLEVGFVLRWDGERFVEEALPTAAGETDPILLTGVADAGDGEMIAVGLHGNGAYVVRRSCT